MVPVFPRKQMFAGKKLLLIAFYCKYSHLKDFPRLKFEKIMGNLAYSSWVAFQCWWSIFCWHETINGRRGIAPFLLASRCLLKSSNCQQALGFTDNQSYPFWGVSFSDEENVFSYCFSRNFTGFLGANIAYFYDFLIQLKPAVNIASIQCFYTFALLKMVRNLNKMIVKGEKGTRNDV